MKKKMSREDWEEYAKSKTVTCAVSGTSMEKPKTITQLSKEQLEDMCLNLMHVDNEKTKIIKEQENRINDAISYNRAIVKIYEEEVGFVKSNAQTNLLILGDKEFLNELRGKYE